MWLVKAAGFLWSSMCLQNNMVEKKADGATTKNVAEERPTEFHANGSLANYLPEKPCTGASHAK